MALGQKIDSSGERFREKPNRIHKRNRRFIQSMSKGSRRDPAFWFLDRMTFVSGRELANSGLQQVASLAHLPKVKGDEKKVGQSLLFVCQRSADAP